MTRPRVVMAIYPNAIGFGFALMTSPVTLIDCGMSNVRPVSNDIILTRIRKLIDRHSPQGIVIQKLGGKRSRKTTRVKELLKGIERLGIEKGLHVSKYTRDDVRLVFTELGATTKYEIAQLIIKGIPRLKNRRPRFRKPWMAEPYQMGIFDAISLADTHFYMTE